MLIADRKKSQSSIIKTRFTQTLSKNIPRTQYSAYRKFQDIQPVELKVYQEWRLIEANEKHASLNSDSKPFEEYPFAEEPVRFHFRDDYGTRQFRQLRNAILCETMNKQMPVGLCERAIRGLKYSDDEIYNFSSEEDMIDSFLKENLL